MMAPSPPPPLKPPVEDGITSFMGFVVGSGVGSGIDNVSLTRSKLEQALFFYIFINPHILVCFCLFPVERDTAFAGCHDTISPPGVSSVRECRVNILPNAFMR